MKKLIALVMLFAFVLSLGLSLKANAAEKKYSVTINFKKANKGQAVDVKFVADKKWDDHAWVGLLPVGAKHGNAQDVDNADISWQYLHHKESGTLVFAIPSTAYSGGMYEFRLMDGEGSSHKERAFSKSFKVN